MGRKKNVVIDDDEYSIGTELSEESQPKEEKAAPAGGGKKKGKKGKGAKGKDEEDKNVVDGEEEDEAPEVVFAGKKKPKGKKGGGSKVSFALLEDEGNDDKDEDPQSEDDAAPVVSFTGKKKSSKGSKKGGNVGFSTAGFDVLGDKDSVEVEAEEDEDAKSEDDSGAFSFSGRKKSSKGKKGASAFSSSAFDALSDGEGDAADSSLTQERSGKDADESGNEDGDAPISFSGKKKKSKSGKKSSDSVFVASGFASLDDDDEPTEKGEGDGATITFTGKKKSSKKKSSTTFSALGDDLDEAEPKDLSASTNKAEIVEPIVQKVEVANETSKSKKKKKKAGRTVQEEDELDKLLAELGEGPSTSLPTPVTDATQEEKVVIQPESVVVDEAGAGAAAEKEDESAAAKKKKKKKEKEKEKKAASAASAAQVKEEEKKLEEKKVKVDDKKVSKKVREMQEALARRQEAEDRKKREEEEKLRKEEEERLRQEELEKEAEEARRRKKEREKEKLLKKKLEGKLLTGKQKDEQRRLEAMRNQFLAGKGISLPAEGGAPAKRPIYSTKKTKANGAAPSKTATVDEDEIKQQDAEDAEYVVVDNVDEENEEVEKDESPIEVKEDVSEEEDDDDDEWDAKSWDDAELALNVKGGAFEDEELDSEPEHVTVVKKEVKKSTQTAVHEAPPLTAVAKPATPAPKEVRSQSNSSALQSEVSEVSLRSPICCIMGHVDTGKTKLLDCIRGTNVQEGEAGGITQQIGATYFPAVNIRERTKELKADAKLKVPGLLVIDTPGHESFTNLRSRGSGLCDIAILVVDIMHGLEPQTIESLNLLKMRKTEFIVALNKVDRLYGWKTCRNSPIVKAMKQQSKDVQNEFNHRLVGIITQFKEQGMNTELYYKNKEMGETFSIVPTSAISGEGIPDMLLLLVQWTQKTMTEKLTYSDDVQCTVLEVKVIEGHGTTIDVILVNGVLHEGDQIVVCGMQGPIVTSIRALLTPHPMKELRIKGSYVHHKEIKAAQGIKITAQGLEHAIAGTSLHVVGPDDDVEDIKASAMSDMQSVMTRIDKSGEGVCVQASTLGSLEALLEFLKTPEVNIPVSGISIGPVHKKDVMRAGVMLEKKKEYATILAFDVKVTPEAREYADEAGVKIFIADIIYHLFDQFKAYIQNLKEEQKKEAADEAVFPCVLKILPNCVFNKKDPIVLGVVVVEGIAKIGTPLCIPTKDFICIGKISSIENNHKPVDVAKKSQTIAIKIIGSNPDEQQKMFGRHFEMEDELVSQISRKSIDILKASYREELSLEDWRLVAKLKTLFKIQ